MKAIMPIESFVEDLPMQLKSYLIELRPNIPTEKQLELVITII
jgi:hypothetical protein